MSQARRLGALALFAALCAGQPPGLQVPFVKQQKNGCGAASVAMVMRYWGGHSATVSAIPSAQAVYQRLYEPGLKGIQLAEMKRYLEEQGYQAYTLRGEWNDIEQHLSKGRPVIVALKPGARKPVHFAVLSGAAGEAVLLNDPTKKKPGRMARRKFDAQWSRAERWMLVAAPARGS